MKTSEHGLVFLCSEEGEVDRPYRDEARIWTVGCGHRLQPTDRIIGLSMSPDGIWVGKISHQQALDLLAKDVAVAESAVNSCCAHAPAPISQNAFDACVSLTYNIGDGGFASSHVRQYLLAGDLESAANAFLMWDKILLQGQLVVSQKLLARRQRERSLFLTPDNSLS